MGHKYLWLSYPLTESTSSYGDGERLNIEAKSSISKGDNSNTSKWILPNHLGTHIDFSRHFFNHGKTVDDYAPEFWVFNSVLLIQVDLSRDMGRIITPEMVVPYIGEKAEIVLIKTGMGKYRNKRAYWEQNPGLSPEIGLLIRRDFPNIRVVGFDFISVSSWQHREIGREAHRAFLDPDGQKGPILLIEDMDFSRIDDSVCIKRLIILPLRVTGTNGAPCTVIAEVS